MIDSGIFFDVCLNYICERMLDNDSYRALESLLRGPDRVESSPADTRSDAVTSQPFGSGADAKPGSDAAGEAVCGRPPDAPATLPGKRSVPTKTPARQTHAADIGRGIMI